MSASHALGNNINAAHPPLKLQDLPNAAELAALPQWKQIRQLHQAAVDAGCAMYIDPATGYCVMTALYLQQRPCCGNKCRHCPYGYKNVPQSQQSEAEAAAQRAEQPLDW